MITATLKVEELPNGCLIFEFTPTPGEKATVFEARVGAMVGRAVDIIMETIAKHEDTLQSTIVTGAKDDGVYEATKERIRNFKYPDDPHR